MPLIDSYDPYGDSGYASQPVYGQGQFTYPSGPTPTASQTGPVLGSAPGQATGDAYEEVLRQLAASIRKRQAARDLDTLDIQYQRTKRDQKKVFERNSEIILTPYLRRRLRKSGITDVARGRFFQDRNDQASDTEIDYTRGRAAILEALQNQQLQDLLARSQASRNLLPDQQAIAQLFGGI